MKKKKISIHEGIVVGTSGNKYSTKNPIARYLINNFDKAIGKIIKDAAPTKILELGCGEGHVTNIILEKTSAEIVATDISESILEKAREKIKDKRVSFKVINAESFSADDEILDCDFVVCCEVLEHLNNPTFALKNMREINADRYLFSVPREPLWRILNFVRGAYISDFGNSPGHIQHWSKKRFTSLLENNGFNPEIICSPPPWTIAFCKKNWPDG